MQLVHVIGRMDAVRRAEGSKHLGREFEIDHIDRLVAVKSKFAP